MDSLDEFTQLFEKWWQWVLDDFENGIAHEYSPKDIRAGKGSPRRIEKMNNQMVGLRETGPRHNYEPSRKDELRVHLRKLYEDPEAESSKVKELYYRHNIKYLIEHKYQMFLELKRFERGYRSAKPLGSDVARQLGITQSSGPLPTVNTIDSEKMILDAFGDTTAASSEVSIESPPPNQSNLAEPVIENVVPEKQPIHYDIAVLRKELENTGVDNFEDIKKLEEKYRSADLTARENVSFRIERGTISEKFKRLANFKCMVCEVMGTHTFTFTKRGTNHNFVETHHVIPVSHRKMGTLSTTNLMAVCPNHHRQIHYGNTELLETTDDYFLYRFDEIDVKIPKIKIK